MQCKVALEYTCVICKPFTDQGQGLDLGPERGAGAVAVGKGRDPWTSEKVQSINNIMLKVNNTGSLDRFDIHNLWTIVKTKLISKNLAL